MERFVIIVIIVTNITATIIIVTIIIKRSILDVAVVLDLPQVNMTLEIRTQKHYRQRQKLI